MKKISKIAFLLGIILIMASSCNSQKVTPEQAKSLAKSAYVYAFPAVEHNRAIWSVLVGDKHEVNTINVDARFFTPADTMVVSPNNDTYYCGAVLDVRQEPVILTIPEIKGNRDFLFQILDIFTNCPDYISKLATGPGPGHYLITRSDWDGDVPTEINHVVKVPATVILVLGRIQVYDEHDAEAEELANLFRISNLSAFTGTVVSEIEPLEWPSYPFNAKTGDVEGFFNMFNYMIQYQILNDFDKELMEEYAAIGLEPGKEFNKADFSPEIWEAIEEGALEGKNEIIEKLNDLGSMVNGWQFSPVNAGRWGTDYITNAAAAWKYIYVNTMEEAIYTVGGVDGDGNVLNTANANYTITFSKEQLPQANFFWSLTMYGQNGYLIENELNRYNLRNAMDLKYGDDGSLIIYIQKDNPGKDKESNWLPAPDKEFYMILRLYGPTQDVIDGKWEIPAVVKEN